MKKRPVRSWKKHKQVIVALNGSVRCEVDKKIARLIQQLNAEGIETRYSCQGRNHSKAYVSMFATPKSVGLAHYLLEHCGDVAVTIERHNHYLGYRSLIFRWDKKDRKAFETLVKSYFQR